MKTKLLTICLLLFTSQVYAQDDLSGKKLYCVKKLFEGNVFYIKTFNFISSSRFEEIVYYPAGFYDKNDNNKIYGSFHKYEGDYSVTSRVRYILFERDLTYNSYYGNKSWKEEIDKFSEYDKAMKSGNIVYYLDREKLKIQREPFPYKNNSDIPCKTFNGSTKELSNKAEVEFFRLTDIERLEQVKRQKKWKEQKKNWEEKKQKKREIKDKIQREKNKI